MSGGRQSGADSVDEATNSVATGSDDLWLDRFARYLGFGRLAERVPGGLPPSYLYAIVTIVLFNAGTITYNLINDVPLIYRENPYFALQPIILLGAVYGARSLQRAYERAMVEMQVSERADDPESLLGPVPSWLPWTLFILGAGLQLARATLDMAGWGVTDFIANFLVFPFVFVPIVIQFFVVYMSIEFFAPWQLSKSEVGIYFLDPQGVGGLRPLGELVKKAYYYIVAGLVGYALITYAPFVDSTWTVSAAAGTIFTAVWIVTVASVAFAVFTLHRFMHKAKRQEIQRLETELRDYIQNPWDVKTYEVPEEKREQVEDLRERIDHVSATSEYPATFSIWSQLLLSIALPKAIQLLLANA
jgi:ABC-type multidrug transport system fused ATPase/permease subunit